MELFKLFGSIFIDTDAAEKSMQKVEQAAEKLGSKIEKYGKGISDMGGKLTKTVTAGVTALGTASVVSASSFEDAMAKVSTIADESEMSMDDMRAAILGLSDQTGISAAAIAEDVYNAISAGQKTADAVNFVSNSTKLARAGFAETGQSLDVLTTIMNAYGMEAGEVTRVSDVLIQTQNLGKTTVADLSSSMGKVIPTAKSYNVSLEQVASAYTITTAKGIATAESTTYINSMLNELGKSGTKVSDVLKEKTGKSFAELMDEGYSLGDCLELVDKAAREQNLAFNDMWGSAEAAKAGVTLLGESADVFNGRLAEMNDVTGSTETAFGKLETTSFKAQKAINEAKNVLIDLGGTIIEMLVPYLEKGAEKVHEFAEWFKGLDDGTKELIVKIGLLMAVVGPLLSIFGKGVSVVGNIVAIGGKLSGGISGIIKIGGGLLTGATKVIGLFSTAASFIWTTLIPAIASVGAPVLAVIGVVTALVAAGVALYKNWDEICAWAGKAWGAIKDTVGGAVDGIKGFFSDLKEKASAKFHELTEAIGSKAEELKEKAVSKFGELKEKTVEKVMSLKDKAVDKFEELKGAAAEKISSLKERAISGIGEMKDNVSRKISEMKENVVTGFQDMKERAAEKFSDLKERWSEKFSAAREKIVSEAEEIREKVGNKLSQLRDNAVDRISDMAEKAEAGFGKLKEKGAAAVSALKEKVAGNFAEIGEAIFSKFESFGEKMSSIFSGVQEVVKGIVDKIKGFMEFDWKLPKIKLPHFSVEWDKDGILGSLATKMGLPGLPKLGVEWYKKAMDAPMIMDKPTAFGINRSGQVMAGGEAGSEVVGGTETLMRMISAAVAQENYQIYGLLKQIFDLLAAYLPGCASKQLVLDTGVLVGELSGPMDEELGWKRHTDGRWR